jgi:hypothetical protein
MGHAIVAKGRYLKKVVFDPAGSVPRSKHRTPGVRTLDDWGVRLLLRHMLSALRWADFGEASVGC